MSAPWMKFYPSDWRSDQMLRICSMGARGLWMEMLCLMHEAEPRGHLLINGRSLTPRQLASLAGCPPKEVEGYTQELEDAGVFSRADDGTIISRRMIRDHEKAIRDKTNGKGGGNPNLKASAKGPVNLPIKPEVNRGVNPEDKAHGTRIPATQRPDTRQESYPRILVGEELDEVAEANGHAQLTGEESPQPLSISARALAGRGPRP